MYCIVWVGWWRGPVETTDVQLSETCFSASFSHIWLCRWRWEAESLARLYICLLPSPQHTHIYMYIISLCPSVHIPLSHGVTDEPKLFFLLCSRDSVCVPALHPLPSSTITFVFVCFTGRQRGLRPFSGAGTLIQSITHRNVGFTFRVCCVSLMHPWLTSGLVITAQRTLLSEKHEVNTGSFWQPTLQEQQLLSSVVISRYGGL